VTTKFSQFSVGGLLLNSDIIVGLRGGNNYKFQVTGIGDSNGNNLFTWSQPIGPGNATNYINVLSAFTLNTPVLSAKGSDTDVNFGIQGQGAGYVHFLGTGAIALTSGTTGQRPAAITGGLRYNSTTDNIEYWSIVNAAWEALSPTSSTVTSIAGTANEITASAATGAVTLSIPATFIAPGTIAATTSSAATSFLLNGATDGVISILPQAHAGTYNFNLPTTAGTSGYVLTSAGGAGSPMTWTNLSTATVTSIAGTANQITASAATGAVTLSTPNTFIAPGTIAATTSVSSPSYLLTGSIDGTISILGQAHAGTYNFNLPTTAGTSGYVLTSGGGAGAPMTWLNLGGTPVITLAGDSGSATGATITISGGTTGLTTSAAASTMNLTGVLKLINGGTNAALTASNGGIFYSTATAGAILAGTATANQMLQSGSSAAPAWSTATWPATTTVNQLLYSSSANTVAGLATGNNGVLITSGGGVPSISSTLPAAVQGNITATGALASGSLAAGFTPVTVPIGGTGNTTFTAYSVICAGTTATGVFQNVSGVGSSGQVLTSNGAAALPTWQAAGGGGTGTALVDNIHQVAHGFSVQQLVYLSAASTFSLAKADTAAHAEVVGIVTTVTDADNFKLTTAGYCTGLSGLTAAVVYFLDDATAGLLTATAPSAVASILKPVFVADTTTSGYFINYRGEIIPSAATTGTVTSVGTGTGLRGGTITTTGTINLGTTDAMSHRLTLTSATPVTTTDVTAATTLYLTPYKGYDIDIYSGSVWVRFQQTELSISNGGLSASTPYDVFIQYNSGTPQLSLTAWTNATTRATALAYQNGVLVLSGTTTSRYLGTVYMDGSTKFNDAATGAGRTVWNYYNRVNKQMVRQETTNQWNYTTATYREANGSSSNQLNFVVGVSEDLISANVVSTASNSLANFGVGVGLDSTSTNSATVCTTNGQVSGTSTLVATYTGLPGIGSHYLAWLEISQAAGTTAWQGQNTLGSCVAQSGIYGNIFC